MKKGLKKWLALSIVIALTMTLLAGCGQGTGQSEKDSTAAQTEAKSGEKAPEKQDSASGGEKVTISLAMHVANVKDQDPATYAAVQEFMKKNPNITVDLQGTETNEHIKKMKMMAQANTLPDIFWMLPAPAAEMAKAGNIADLTEFINSNKELADSFLPNMLEAYKLDGKQFGLPYQPLVTGFWYNKAIFDKYGVKLPETYDDLKEAVKVFKKNNVVTIAKGAKDPYSVWAFLIMICRYGYFDKIDNIMAKQEKYNNPDFLKFYQKIDELRQLGAFPENVSTMNYFQAVEMFIAGKSAMLDAGIWEAQKIEQSEIGKDVGFWWGPTFSDGVGSQTVSMVVPAAPFVVSASTQKDQVRFNAVKEFLKFYFSPESAKIQIDNQISPVIKYTGDINADKHPVFAKVIEQVNKPGWVSPKSQPDLVVPEAVGNAMYDSIYGVINGVYTPEQAMDVVDKVIAEQ